MLAASTVAAAAVIVAHHEPPPPRPGGESAAPALVVAGAVPAPELVVPDEVPAPSEVVRETGAWFAHGTTLDLRPDGTGTLAHWVGAFDGDRIALRLIPAPGEAAVAEITAIETVGRGALDAAARPGIGGLVPVSFGARDRTAHVEWTSGGDRYAVDLCPAEGLDAAAMEALRCGA